MKVTGVRTTAYKVKLSRPIADANKPEGQDEFAFLAVFLNTDEGLTGVTLSSPGAAAHIHSMVEQHIVGHDPRGVRGLWKTMLDAVFKGGQVGIANAALSAIDTALWDLKAKINDEPLWKTLGASQHRVRAYASGIDLCLSDEEIYKFYASMAEQGTHVGKLKVGLDRESDLRRIGIMEEALATSGKRPRLIIDSNEYWSAKQAILNISYFEKHHELFWVEEPARRWDYAGLRKVSESVRAAVGTGENLQQLPDYKLLIANQAVDVVQVGLGAGGVTGALNVANLAYAFDLPMSLMNAPANYSAPVATAVPNHMMMEVVDAGREKGMRFDSHIEDGWIVLGDKPGLGLEFDEPQLAKMTLDDTKSVPGLWGRRQGGGLFEVSAYESPWDDE